MNFKTSILDEKCKLKGIFESVKYDGSEHGMTWTRWDVNKHGYAKTIKQDNWARNREIEDGVVYETDERRFNYENWKKAPKAKQVEALCTEHRNLNCQVVLCKNPIPSGDFFSKRKNQFAIKPLDTIKTLKNDGDITDLVLDLTSRLDPYPVLLEELGL